MHNAWSWTSRSFIAAIPAPLSFLPHPASRSVKKSLYQTNLNSAGLLGRKLWPVACCVLTDKQTKSKDRGNLFRAFGVPHFSPSSRSGPTMNHFTGSAVFQMISEIIKIYLCFFLQRQSLMHAFGPSIQFTLYWFILKEQSFISECSY